MTVPGDVPPAGRGFLGHPRGLPVLFGTEGFLSFGYYGMQSILVLFLSARMLRPGHAGQVLGLAALGRLLGWSGTEPVEAHAASLAGLIGAVAFAAPLAGGVVADRLLGRTRAMVTGIVLLVLGFALLACETLFLVGLPFVLCGLGLAGTVKAQLGALYAADDPRRSDGFQIWAFSVQLAVLAAPVVCGTLGEGYSWSWGFGAAAAGAALALVVYLSGFRALPAEPPPAGLAVADRTAPRLTGRDRLIVLGLVLLLPVLALAAIGNQEIYSGGYLLWARDHYDLRWGGRSLPVSWLLSVDAFISMGTTFLSVGFWTWLERRGRPVSELPKIAVGAGFCASAVLVLAAAPAGRVGLGWGLGFHVLDDIGFTNTYYVALALYSRLAPPALGSTVVNLCVLQIFGANLLVSRLAGLLGSMPASRFWLLHGVLIGGAAVVLALAAGAEHRFRERSARAAFAS